MYEYKRSPEPNGVFLLLVLLTLGITIPATWWMATQVVAMGWADRGAWGAIRIVALPTILVGLGTFKGLEAIAFKIGLSPYTIPK